MFSAEEAAFLDAWAACASTGTSVSGSVSTPVSPVASTNGQGSSWSSEEHERFLEAMQLYPTGPWKAIAAHIGTRTPRQARTHAQKHKEKLHRRQHKLRRMQSYLVVDRSQASLSASRRHGIPWTPTEQQRLQEGLELFPTGPWRAIASHVGTRTVRQVMAYALKRRQDQQELAVVPSPWDETSIESLPALELTPVDELLSPDDQFSYGETDTNELLHRLLFVDDDGATVAVGASDH